MTALCTSDPGKTQIQIAAIQIPVDYLAHQAVADGVSEQVSGRFRKGLRLAASGRLKEAVDAFESALELDSGHADAYFQRGVCVYRLGLVHRAEQDMTAAALLGSETAQLWSRFEGMPLSEGNEGDGDGDYDER